jgi:hypothetical protein
MKRITIKILILIATVLGVSCHTIFGVSDQMKEKRDAMTLLSELEKNTHPNTLSTKEEKNGWKLLFNGKASQSWREFNQTEFPSFWTIEDGSLTMTSTGGHESQDIIYPKKFRSFALSVDFKLTKGANSGIIFQVAEDPKYKFPFETGPEFQVIDHENWPDKLEDWQICGANYAMYPPLVRHFKPVGEWNHALLVVDGNHVTQILNGEVVVKYEKYSDDWTQRRNSGKWKNYPDYGKFDEGYISLQNHGTKVWYRNIKIKEF